MSIYLIKLIYKQTENSFFDRLRFAKPKFILAQLLLVS